MKNCPSAASITLETLTGMPGVRRQRNDGVCSSEQRCSDEKDSASPPEVVVSSAPLQPTVEYNPVHSLAPLVERVAAIVLAWVRRGRWIRVQPLESALRSVLELGHAVTSSCAAGSRGARYCRRLM